MKELGPWLRLGANGQSLASLGAPALQNETAIFGAHPDQKPVRPTAVATIWLKRSLAFHSVLRKALRGRSKVTSSALVSSLK
jgi:hypothetical protein